MFWGDFIFLHEIFKKKKAPPRWPQGPLCFTGAGLGGFAEVLLPLDVSNLLLLAKQVREPHFFPKKLSEMAAAAAASGAVLNL